MSIQRYVARTLTAVTGPDLRDDSGVVVLYPDHLAALAEQEKRHRKEIEDVLDAYSRWLENAGFMDSDWWTEGNTVQDFLADRREGK